MKQQMTRILMLVALAGALALAAPARAEVKLSFDHFYNHAELTGALKTLAQAYPQLASVASIGKSAQGRDLWAITICNPKTGPAEHKPAFYIDGNIHGNEIQAAEVALYTAYTLLTHYDQSEQVRRLVDEKVFYIIPTMNPDSRDYFLSRPVNSNSPRSGLIPYDDDHDGVADEDGPDDLDGDGAITMMRKKDPTGNYRVNPEEPRLMIPVRPGEKGEYVMLGGEGIDNDGDGLVNEDGPGGYDMNRNYGYDWQPDFIQSGAGNYPFCWPETQAIRDFLLAHPNIAGAQNFHNHGGYILKGPGTGALGEWPAADARAFDYVGKQGEKILPGYKYSTIYRDLYTVHGGSIDFIYCTLGIFAFTNELDFEPFGTRPADSRAAANVDESEDMAYCRRLLEGAAEMFYYDKVLLGEYVTPWKPYKHPLYGDIEIGGVKQFGRRVPPLFKLAETCHRNMAFCLFHAEQLPRLALEAGKIKALDGGIYEVELNVKNERATPSMTAQASQNRLHRADRLLLSGTGAKLLAAGEVQDKYRGLTRKLKVRPESLWLEGGVPGFGQRSLRLLVKGQGEITLVYDSLKGGRAQTRVSLK